MGSWRYSGAISEPWDHVESQAISFYESVRQLSDNDYNRLISTISQNTGFDIDMIDDVIGYVFFDEHQLERGSFERFDEDIYIAASIQRLYDGNYYDCDIILLQHEYLEHSIVITDNKTPDQAHIDAVQEFDYWQSIIDLQLDEDELKEDALNGQIRI